MLYDSKTIALAAALMFLAGIANADDCAEAEQFSRLAEEAESEGNFQSAANWLNTSLDLCPAFANWYQLGRVEQELGNEELALAAYERAVHYAQTSDEKAVGVARYGQMLGLEDQVPEGVTMLQAARRMHSPPVPDWMTEETKALDLSLAGSPASTEQIMRGLTSPHYELLGVPVKGEQSADEKRLPSVNIRVNFLFGSSKVDALSQESIAALAAVLSDQAYSQHHFLLIGHSDARGGADHNAQLSLERAEAVRDMLVAIEPGLEGRVDTTGYGESNPLYNGDTDEDYQLNRRLEVVVE